MIRSLSAARNRALFSGALVVFLTGSAAAKTLSVSSSGKGDYLTIEEALRDSKPGDRLVLLDTGRVGMELERRTGLRGQARAGRRAQKAGSGPARSS